MSLAPARSRPTTALSVYALGAVHGLAGFCAGPILGSVLTVAALGGNPGYGGAPLAVYALGMAVPLFLLASSGNLALIGVYFFTFHIHAAVDAIPPSARGELEITDAVQWLVASGADVRASEYSGYWQDTGRVADVLECNRRLFGDLTGDVAGEVDEESVLVGPVVLEAGARIVRSRVEGPVIIGAGTTVEDSRIGAYTSIGRDCVLRRSGIGHSITLDGATVTDVPSLHGSMIGRFAVVGADRESPGHRLIIGDDARVEVAA